jgi:hypothetical protein
MLGVWQDVLDGIEATTGITSYPVIFTVAFVVAVSIPIGLLALASLVAARWNLESARGNFARFGYALIPLDVAAHLAHNLFHLLAEGGTVVTTVAHLVGIDSTLGAALVGTGTIQVLQMVLLALGAIASAYAVRRIAHRRYRTTARRRATVVPFVLVVAALTVVNVWLFTLPMAHRM